MTKSTSIYKKSPEILPIGKEAGRVSLFVVKHTHLHENNLSVFFENVLFGFFSTVRLFVMSENGFSFDIWIF